MTTYRMVMIGGKARMSRPSSVVYPLPAVRLNTDKLTRSLRVGAPVRTEIHAIAWKPGTVLARPALTITFP